MIRPRTRLALAALAAPLVVAVTGAHAAEPRALPGWPRAAPSGTVHQGPGGGVVVVSQGGLDAFAYRVTAYRRDGRRLWASRRRASCGNCDEGPQPEMLQPNGVYGPIGPEGDDTWAVDARGRIVGACVGVARTDGSCFTGGVLRDPATFIGAPAMFGAPVGEAPWRVGVPGYRWEDDFGVPPMTVTDRGGTLYSAFFSPTRVPPGPAVAGLLIGVDRDARTIRWTREGSTQALLGLPFGALVSEGAGIAVVGPDGTVLWSRPLPARQTVRPADTARSRAFIVFGRTGGGSPGVTAVNAVTGAFAWRTRPSDRARLLSVGRGGRVYLAIDAPGRTAVRAVRFVDGTTVWQRRTRLEVRGARELANGSVAVSAGRRFAPSADDRLTLLDPSG